MSITISIDDTPEGSINYSEIYSKIWSLMGGKDFLFLTGNIYYKLVDETLLRTALNEEAAKSWRDTSELTFVPGTFDCTEYSKALLGYLVKYFYPKSPCIGMTYIKKPVTGNHNQLFFMNLQKELFLLEPQNDTWMPWTSSYTVTGVFM